MREQLIKTPAWQMAELVRQKQVSPVELVEAHFTQIERLNPILNAFVDLRHDAATAEARALETKLARGETVGPLAGIPVSIKSSIDVANMKCEAGSRLRQGNIPQSDAVLVSRLKQAGAVVLGVTNTPEFLMAYESDNLIYGRTSNPWNLDHSAGGSSGGESAAIAACMSAAGVGSDGGGSIRVPAHFTGICGLKPTPGVIPSSGHFPVGVGPFALTGQVGPMARTVKDLSLMLRVMAGADTGDPMAAPYELSESTGKELRQLKIGWFNDDGLHPPTEETREAVRSAANALADQCFSVEPFLPEGLERARELWYTIFCRFSGLAFGPLLSGHEHELSFLMRDLGCLQSREKPLSAADVLFTLFERDILRERFVRQMDEHQILLLPASSGPAFRHGHMGWTRGERPETFVDTMVYSQWFNLLGLPAAIVPVGQSPEGLPIGVQIVGLPFKEHTVLAVAEAVERSFGWKAPPILTN
jgi:Asp-tRNA(Asn)/Glu-tRNA(Gln) amidotransferase A subunit family amidase